MASPVTLDQLKARARLSEDAGEDALLQLLLNGATRAVELHLERDLATDSALTDADLIVIGQAIIVLATAWYEDREGARGVPAAVAALLRPLRSWAR